MCAGVVGGIRLTDKDGVYTPLHVSPAIRASETTLLVTLGPGIQSLEPGEFGIIHGDYRMPSDNCEYLLDFNHEEYGSTKWCLFKKKKRKMLYHWTRKHLCWPLRSRCWVA